MTYHVVERWGGSEHAPSVARMREILAELDVHDDEHPDAWLTHESGWSLSVSQHGGVILQNIETDAPPRHLHGVSRERVLELWQRLAAGDLAALEREDWQPGYGDFPLSETEHASADLASDRQLYDSLGPERAEARCRATGCSRGAVFACVLCRVHQFEELMRRPCPFSH